MGPLVNLAYGWIGLMMALFLTSFRVMEMKGKTIVDLCLAKSDMTFCGERKLALRFFVNPILLHRHSPLNLKNGSILFSGCSFQIEREALFALCW